MQDNGRATKLRIQVGNTIYRRNRRHLICTDEPRNTDDTTLDQQTEDVEGNRNNRQRSTTTMATSAQDLRRSQRNHRPPHWMEDCTFLTDFLYIYSLP